MKLILSWPYTYKANFLPLWALGFLTYKMDIIIQLLYNTVMKIKQDKGHELAWQSMRAHMLSRFSPVWLFCNPSGL